MRHPHAFLLAVLLLGLPSLIPAAPASLRQAPPPLAKGTAPGAQAPVARLIVKLRGDSQLGPADRVAGLGRALGHTLRLQRGMSGGAQVVDLERPMPAAQAEALAARLARQAGVEYASPDYLRQPSAVPDDPEWGLLWHLMNPGETSDGETVVGGARLAAAWDITTGSSSTVVAVVDTGVLPHPEFSARLLPGYDFIGSLFLGNDGNGRDSDASDPGNWVTAAEAGVGMCTAIPEAQDSDWHGTRMAGIIAAQGNNATDIAGISWQTRILPVRVLGKCGGYDSDVIDGMRWAAGLTVTGVPANPTPADVINLSLGSPSSCSAAYAAAVAEVNALGISVVGAAGNDISYSIHAPANCPGVIAVTGHAIDGTSYIFANVGPEVALSAPAGGWGTDPDGGATGWRIPLLTVGDAGTMAPTGTYQVQQVEGTSEAAALVSGTIALIRTLLPTASPTLVRELLTGNSRPFAPGSWCTREDEPQTGSCGAGLLDAEDTVNAARLLANHAPVIAAQPVQSGRAGVTLQFQLATSDEDGNTLTHTALSLPPGATLSAAGEFTWSTPVAGTHVISFEVSDGLVTSGPGEVTLVIATPRAPFVDNGGAAGPGGLFLLGLLGLRYRLFRRLLPRA